MFLESEEDVKKNLQIESEKLLAEIKEIESQESRKSRKTSSKRFRAVSAMIQRVEVPLEKNAI